MGQNHSATETEQILRDLNLMPAERDFANENAASLVYQLTGQFMTARTQEYLRPVAMSAALAVALCLIREFEMKVSGQHAADDPEGHLHGGQV